MVDATFSRPKVNSTMIILLAIFLVNSIFFWLIYRQVTSTPAGSVSPTLAPQLADTDRLTRIETDLAVLKSQVASLEQVRGAVTTSGLAGALPDLDVAATKSLTIKDPKFATIDVYDLPLASSKVIGRLDFGRQYHFTSQQGSWYQVQLPDGTFGWVNSQLVTPYE